MIELKYNDCLAAGSISWTCGFERPATLARCARSGRSGAFSCTLDVHQMVNEHQKIMVENLFTYQNRFPKKIGKIHEKTHKI